MTSRQQVYSCSVCGQLVAVVHHGGGRLVCCGKPMNLAGEEAGTGAQAARKLRSEPAPAVAAPSGAPYWRCGNCKYVLQSVQPPETCPSCRQACQFSDVTCYIPECGFSGADTRLINQ